MRFLYRTFTSRNARATLGLRGLLKVCSRSVAKSRYGNRSKLSDICLTFVSAGSPSGGKGERHKLYVAVKTRKTVHPGVSVGDVVVAAPPNTYGALHGGDEV